MTDLEDGGERRRERGAGGRRGFAALGWSRRSRSRRARRRWSCPFPAACCLPRCRADNPPTAAKVELGKKLYFDTRISTDGTIACVSCHDPRSGFADPRGKPTSAGVGGALGTRNAPTSLNAAFLASQFWDGRAATLEAQAVLPLVNPIEHGFGTGRPCSRS